MANQLEIEQVQKERLFDLLMLQKDNPGLEINGLKRLLTRAKAPMTAENISLVEKLVEELVSK